LLIPQFLTEELKTPVPEKDGGHPVRIVSALPKPLFLGDKE